MSARRRVWIYVAVAFAAIGVSATLTALSLTSVRGEVNETRESDLDLRDITALRTTLADWQIFFQPVAAGLTGPAPRLMALDVATGSTFIETEAVQARAMIASLKAAGHGSVGGALAIAQSDFARTTAFSTLAALIAQGAPADMTAAIASEGRAFKAMWTVTAAAAIQFRGARDTNSRQSLSFLDHGRAVSLGADAIAAVLLAIAALTFDRRARIRERDERSHQRYQEFEAELHLALEMAKGESDAYKVMAEALVDGVPTLQVEMLVADSSHAHFTQTLAVGNEATPRSWCSVQSPLDCPATTRGQTLVFPSSREMSACPYLKARESGAMSAACVAVSITGMSVGVVHATSVDGVPPTEAEIQYLEVTSRHSSERIAMLRAFEKSESQAHTDPLTGLWNRRSLENRVHDLQRDGTPYSLAYGDLDHFKVLNDTFGHEAGDQALRLFSQVLVDSIRPADFSARYGGEEFVIIFPECSPSMAVQVLDRLREHLALTLSSGRMPPFTVSFGVATSIDGETFDDVVAVADSALLAAKGAGRNRTLLAGAGAGVGSFDVESTAT